MFIKELIKRIIKGYKYSSDTYIKYLRSIGVKIGEDCTIYVPSKTWIDEQYPFLITIGNHVRIADGVKILTHDYAWSVLKSKYEDFNYNTGGILGASGAVNIGNNVFIGMNSVINRNVRIGNNVIIGVGSVVTKNCEDNGVYVGNPARRIMEISEYYKKRKDAQLKEAKILAIKYFERYGTRPSPEVFHEYFMIFENYDSYKKNSVFVKKMRLCKNERESQEYLKQNPPLFNDYNEFMRWCFEDE